MRPIVVRVRYARPRQCDAPVAGVRRDLSSITGAGRGRAGVASAVLDALPSPFVVHGSYLGRCRWCRWRGRGWRRCLSRMLSTSCDVVESVDPSGMSSPTISRHKGGIRFLLAPVLVSRDVHRHRRKTARSMTASLSPSVSVEAALKAPGLARRSRPRHGDGVVARRPRSARRRRPHRDTVRPHLQVALVARRGIRNSHPARHGTSRSTRSFGLGGHRQRECHRERDVGREGAGVRCVVGARKTRVQRIQVHY